MHSSVQAFGPATGRLVVKTGFSDDIQPLFSKTQNLAHLDWLITGRTRSNLTNESNSYAVPILPPRKNSSLHLLNKVWSCRVIFAQLDIQILQSVAAVRSVPTNENWKNSVHFRTCEYISCEIFNKTGLRSSSGSPEFLFDARYSARPPGASCARLTPCWRNK